MDAPKRSLASLGEVRISIHVDVKHSPNVVGLSRAGWIHLPVEHNERGSRHLCWWLHACWSAWRTLRVGGGALGTPEERSRTSRDSPERALAAHERPAQSRAPAPSWRPSRRSGPPRSILDKARLKLLTSTLFQLLHAPPKSHFIYGLLVLCSV